MELTKLVLNNAEKESTLCSNILKYLDNRLQYLRLQNDTYQPESQTAELRGRIAEAKSLIALLTSTEEKGRRNSHDQQ